MTLQQLRYLIAIARCGSISSAAHELYISQSSLSIAVKDIEQECGVTVFERSAKGITLTKEGSELLGYARQIVEQAELMEERYMKKAAPLPQHLSIASQHYAFSVEAFLDFLKGYEGESYTFRLREMPTSEVIEQVRSFKSDIGIIYLSKSNEQAMGKSLEEAGAAFHPLFSTRPHIFVGKLHPLAKRKSVQIDELAPYPRYSFDQGSSSSPMFAEEPFAELPHDREVFLSDRGTLTNLLTHHDGFMVSTGVPSGEMRTDVVSIPIQTDEKMVVGFIVNRERQLSSLAQRYIEALRLFIEEYNKGFAAL